jgi:hypothetical protein
LPQRILGRNAAESSLVRRSLFPAREMANLSKNLLRLGIGYIV